ncbi:MAG TPA: MerR family transcriptional regulator [Acidimicrobiia bacterium]|jgi:DNA-binding transcriptional MerR regulator
MTTAAEPARRRRGGSDLLSIGQLAALTGVSSRTIRYYEELGILPEPHRSPGGTRKYTRDHRFYVEGALALKDLGFRLEEIELIGRIALGEKVPAEQRARVAELVRGNMRGLEHKIKVLHRLREILVDEAATDATAGAGDGGEGPSRLAGLLGHPPAAG